MISCICLYESRKLIVHAGVMGGVGRHTWKTSIEAQKMAVKAKILSQALYYHQFLIPP